VKVLTLDIETDHLLQKCTRCWIIGWHDSDTDEIRYWLDGDLGWKVELDKADIVVGHNAVSFDLMVLEKLFGYRLPSRVRQHDTLLMSLVLNYNRFPGGAHGLGNWGASLG